MVLLMQKRKWITQSPFLYQLLLRGHQVGWCIWSFFQWSMVAPNDSLKWISLQLMDHSFKATKELLWINIIFAILWKIWDERNVRIFQNIAKISEGSSRVRYFLCILSVQKFNGLLRVIVYHSLLQIGSIFCIPYKWTSFVHL